MKKSMTFVFVHSIRILLIICIVFIRNRTDRINTDGVEEPLTLLMSNAWNIWKILSFFDIGNKKSS